MNRNIIRKTRTSAKNGGGMIVGIGIDIVKTERIEQAFEKHGARFADRVFTLQEQALCERKKRPAESYAGRFAVKEAAFKALGHGWDECGGFLSVEIAGGDNARPTVVFHGNARKYAEEYSVAGAHISITHDGGMAAAVVVLER